MVMDRRKTVQSLKTTAMTAMVKNTEKHMESSLTERDKLELLKLLEEHGGIAEAVDVEHKTRKYTDDEVCHIFAAQAFKEAHRDSRGFIIRNHTSQILGVLDKMTDQAVIDGYRGLRQHVGEPVNAAPAFFGTLFHILITRRGLAGKV